MNVIEALYSIHSVLANKPDPVQRETLIKIMQAANQTPSWADTQPWEIFIAAGKPLDNLRRSFLERFDNGIPINLDLPAVKEWPDALRDRMKENGAHLFADLGIDRNDKAARMMHYRRNFKFFGAPAVVYLCMDKTLTHWSVFDLGMMSQSIMLAAKGLGVDSVPAVNLVGYPDLIRRELNIPDTLSVVFGIALVYAFLNDPINKHRSLRRPIEEVVRIAGI